MKILCVIDSLGSGGAQRQLVELAIGFKEKGHEVFFLTYHQINFYKRFLDQENIPIVTILEPNYVKRLFKMRRYIRRGNFDAVLSFLEAANFICEIAGLPFRKWNLIVGERSANPNILKSFKLRIFRYFHFFANYVVANSETNIKIIRKINPLLPRRKCRVIYNMVDFEIWKPSSDYVPLENGKIKMMIAASHRRLKNLNGLIEAVNLLNEREKSQLEIKWYGKKHDDSLEQGLKKIDEYNLAPVFKFYPATTEIKKIMQKSDVIGLFSHYEGLPNTVCEGMACGKPIIATKVSDIPILLDTQNGFLCYPNDVNSISQTLSDMINCCEEKLLLMGSVSRQKAINLFDKKMIIQEYLSLLSK